MAKIGVASGAIFFNAEAGRLNYAFAREQSLPNGSGIIESTVRRVLNLRLKGASIFWTKDNAEHMIFLRSYYKAGHWKTLENKALTCTLQLAAYTPAYSPVMAHAYDCKPTALVGDI